MIWNWRDKSDCRIKFFAFEIHEIQTAYMSMYNFVPIVVSPVFLCFLSFVTGVWASYLISSWAVNDWIGICPMYYVGTSELETTSPPCFLPFLGLNMVEKLVSLSIGASNSWGSCIMGILYDIRLVRYSTSKCLQTIYMYRCPRTRMGLVDILLLSIYITFRSIRISYVHTSHIH